MFKNIFFLYLGIIFIIAAIALYFVFFQLNVIKTAPAVSSNFNISKINYTIENDSYVSNNINFTFTSFFSPWYLSNEFSGKAYNSLIFIPAITNQSNPFQLSNSVYLQFLVNSTNLSLLQTRNSIISNLINFNPDINYTLKNITIDGLKGNQIAVINSSLLNTTYFDFTVNDSTLYLFVLFSSNNALTNSAVSAFFELLKTVSIKPLN